MTSTFSLIFSGIQGVPGRPGHKGVRGIPGSPGYFKMFYKNLRTGENESFTLPENPNGMKMHPNIRPITINRCKGCTLQVDIFVFSAGNGSSGASRKYRFSTSSGMMVDLDNGTILAEKGLDDVVQHVALAFCTSVLFLVSYSSS